MYRHRQKVYKNARHIDEQLIASNNAEKLINYPNKLRKKTSQGVNSSFTNSFMSAMFQDTSLDVAQRQKESVIRDQQK